MDIQHYLPLDEFLNPNKRIYWPYLLLCIVYALLFLIFSKRKVRSLGFDYWFHPSAKVDYAVWFLNRFLQLTVVPLIFINSLQFASIVFHWLVSAFGEFHSTNLNLKWGAIFYALTFFIASDFSRFWVHYIMHKNRFLWNIHRMHHSAEVLTPITFFRVHPLEMLLGYLRFWLVHGIVTGIFLYVYYDVFSFPIIFGASFFVFFSNVLGGNLRHSHIPLGFGFLERFFISPKQHQMHHSKQIELQQSNYGSFFAFWDILFRCWKPSKGVEEIQFGINEQQKQSFSDELFTPIVKLLHVGEIQNGFRAVFQKNNAKN
jgi:sterol desaturase/sphingolipid hydroxylase (fatty acid hydroxylase superfamily)